MDWDKNGSVNFKEFLFAFTRWVGIDDMEDEEEEEEGRVWVKIWWAMAGTCSCLGFRPVIISISKLTTETCRIIVSWLHSLESSMLIVSNKDDEGACIVLCLTIMQLLSEARIFHYFGFYVSLFQNNPPSWFTACEIRRPSQHW